MEFLTHLHEKKEFIIVFDCEQLWIDASSDQEELLGSCLLASMILVVRGVQDRQGIHVHG